VIRLHADVWLRSGVPQRMAPPAGSLLDTLFVAHHLEPRFAESMSFDEVNRWIQHMYECVRSRQLGPLR
jgi:hypothetical protein